MKEIKADAITWSDVKAMQERIGELEEMLLRCGRTTMHRDGYDVSEIVKLLNNQSTKEKPNSSDQ